MKPLSGFRAVAALLAGCSDSFTPPVENVAGEDRLVRLTEVYGTFGSKNWVAEGATLTITLDPNGTTTGRLFIPAPTRAAPTSMST